jgi:hypothetical protein
MSYPVLKKLAIDLVDDFTALDIAINYGQQYSATTKLDTINITAPVKSVMPPRTNKVMGEKYTNDWKLVRDIDIVKCKTIGDFIKLLAKNAKVLLADGEPK